MPSEKVLENKKAMVKQLTERLQNAQAGVLADYRGLTVEQDTELRRKLREANVEYTVLKNSIIRFAAKEVGLEDLDSVLEGPTAIATSNDDVISPGVLRIFAPAEIYSLSVNPAFCPNPFSSNTVKPPAVSFFTTEGTRATLVSSAFCSFIEPIIIKKPLF